LYGQFDETWNVQRLSSCNYSRYLYSLSIHCHADTLSFFAQNRSLSLTVSPFTKGKEKYPKVSRYDIVGSLCENNDKFAIDRELPQVEIGDIVIIHDVGAHGTGNNSTIFVQALKVT
jgi:diaminopimelate decarboxylase